MTAGLGADLAAYSAAADMLHDPLQIAARALQRALEADELHARIVTEYGKAGADIRSVNFKVERLTGQQRSALGVAAALASLAELAATIRAESDAHLPRMFDLGDEEDATDAPAAQRPAPLTDGWPDDERPQPLACRFTAKLEGEPFLIGNGSGGPAMMLFVKGNGWINVDEFDVDEKTPQVFEARGRARSLYRDQVLVTTYGGIAMTLPLAVVNLEPDE